MKNSTKLFLIILLILALVGCSYYINTNDQQVTITVSDKERINPKESSGYYLVYTEEGPVYKVTDLWVRGIFNASDIYGALKKGHKYEVTVVGYRAGFISSYMKIIDYKEIK